MRSEGAAGGTTVAAPAKMPAKPVVVATAPAAAATGSSQRYFEFTDDKSSKFWEISQSGCDVTVRYGRIGASGQTQTKSFADEGAAQRHAEKLIGEKTEKGYVEK